MDLESQVVVVSIFGRGHWMAVELARKGIPTLLLDVTEQMGAWKSEDAIGPFGFFKTEELSEIQNERLFKDGKPQLVPQGLTLWLKSGPFELKGPVTEHRAKALQIPDEVMNYVSGKNLGGHLQKLSFEQNWLAHLSHQFLSTTYSLAAEAAGSSMRVPLFASYYVNSSNEKSAAKSLDQNLKWCESHGVKVVRAELRDLAFSDRKTLSGFEIKTDSSGQIQILKTEEVVWCLSGEETSMLGSKIQTTLFPHGVESSEWSWVRYQVKVKELGSQSALTRAQIPLDSLVIEDLMLPWTHENFIVLQKISDSDVFNAWIRVPTQQRFQKQYIENHGRGVLQVLNGRIHDNEVVISESPIETDTTFAEIGPTRFPVYARNVAHKVSRKSLGNMHWDGPEIWPSYHAQSIFESQGQIVKQLAEWWTKKEELRKKREEKQKMKEQRNQL
jgi:hypothetical protein